MSKRNSASGETPSGLSEGLRALTPAQVLSIDRALVRIGAFGEVRIVKKKGCVRFIETLESRDLLKRGNDGRER